MFACGEQLVNNFYFKVTQRHFRPAALPNFYERSECQPCGPAALRPERQSPGRLRTQGRRKEAH